MAVVFFSSLGGHFGSPPIQSVGVIKTQRQVGMSADHFNPPAFDSSLLLPAGGLGRHNTPPSVPPPPPTDHNLVIGSIFVLFACHVSASKALGGSDPPDIFQVSGCRRRSGENREIGSEGVI